MTQRCLPEARGDVGPILCAPSGKSQRRVGRPYGQFRRARRYPPPLVFELRDGPRDECGVFGIHAPGSDVARLTYFALYALQHRGQESAGIAASQGGHIMAMRDKGLVNQVFDEQKLRALHGDMARRARPLLDHRRELVGEHAAGLARRPARGRARPQRQPRQRRRAARRAARRRASRSARRRTPRSSPRCSPRTRPSGSRTRSPTS